MGSLNLILKISLAPALENSTISFQFGTCLYMHVDNEIGEILETNLFTTYYPGSTRNKTNIVHIAFYRDLTTKFTFDDLNHRRDLSGS